MKSTKDVYTISVDPASRLCGVSLWCNKEYIAAQSLESSLKTWSARAAHLRVQARKFVTDNLKGDAIVTRAVCELVPKIAEPSIQMICGSILSDAIFNLDLSRKFLVSPSSWKAWARRNGCTSKDPKGVPALVETAFAEKHVIKSDDVADSIMIFLCWYEKWGV
jgi:hypothetical protein